MKLGMDAGLYVFLINSASHQERAKAPPTCLPRQGGSECGLHQATNWEIPDRLCNTLLSRLRSTLCQFINPHRNERVEFLGRG